MIAPPSPGALRSSRKRALEIGTDPRGFTDTPYDADAGIPILPGLSGGRYVEQAPQVGGGGGPIETEKPFTTKE